MCVCVSRRHTLAVDGRWFSCNFFTSLVWVPLPANLPLRQRIFKFCNGPANPHGAAGVRETNTTSLWVPLPNQQPDGSSAIWHLANMAPRPNDVEPPKAASKKTPNNTRQPPNSACVTGSNPQRWLTSPRHHSEKAETTAITPCMRGVRALIKLLFSSRRRCCWSSRALLRERRGLAGAKRKWKGRRTWRDVAFSFLSKMSSSGSWRLRGSTRPPTPRGHHHNDSHRTTTITTHHEKIVNIG